MAAEGRRESGDLNATAPAGDAARAAAVADVMAEGWRYSFYQAVRLLQLGAPGRAPVGTGDDPARETLRFTSRVSLAFAPSDVHEVREVDGRPEVSVAFMGVATPASYGSLPMPYSELVLDRDRDRDPALRDFLDRFNHRLISLFYRAWEKCHFPVVYERTRPGDHSLFERMVLGLMGMGSPALQGQLDLDDRALLSRAYAVRARGVSALGLADLVADYFGVPAAVDQFVPAWYAVEDEELCRLGRTSCRLGEDACLGARVRIAQSRFRVRLGPLDWPRTADFLPAGQGWPALSELCALAGGPQFDFEFRLQLAPGAVPPLRLGVSDEQGTPWLGWSTWLGGGTVPEDAARSDHRRTPGRLSPGGSGHTRRPAGRPPGGRSMRIDLKSLIGKLTETSRRGLEGAAGLCLSRTNYEVEMEHWLAKLVEHSDGDINRLLRHAGVDPDRVLRGLEHGLDQYKRGNGGKPQLAPAIEDMARQAWLLASINHQRVAGALGRPVPGLPRRPHPAPPAAGELPRAEGPGRRRPGGRHAADRGRLARGPRGLQRRPGRRPRPGPTAAARAAAARRPSLDQFTVDLTAEARAGKIDPVLGRDPEIRQIIDILTRRRQNNPILTGEAGVGKTAVVEGFALRIVAGDVPPVLQNVALRSLDLGLLQAGAGVKGEFENRLKQVIDEVRSSPTPIILFIDEAHTLIGAGGQEGQNDAANLLKPALARGELRTVAATTWAEYKKYFEKDPALTRRFQVVKVEEPDEDAAIRIMRGVAAKLEQHHRVRILDEAVRESVRLSHRYIPARQLPDKSVSVLDTACARVGIGRSATPPAVEDLRRVIDAYDAGDRHPASARPPSAADHDAAAGRAGPAQAGRGRPRSDRPGGALAAASWRWWTGSSTCAARLEQASTPTPTDDGEAPAAAHGPGARPSCAPSWTACGPT